MLWHKTSHNTFVTMEDLEKDEELIKSVALSVDPVDVKR